MSRVNPGRRVSGRGWKPSESVERFDRGLWASVALHVVLAVILITSPNLFPSFDDGTWGSEAGGGGGISVQLVSNLAGVPLPAPDILRPDAVGNDSPGLYEPLPEPEVSAPEESLADAEPIPESFEITPEPPEAAVEPESEPARPAPRPAEPAAPRPAAPSEARDNPAPAPDNAVPFGEGGQSAISGGFSTGAGTGLDFGDGGAFGQQYGTYVRAMRQRISDNWYQSMVNVAVPAGQRVTFAFDILRSGQIENVHLVESSGNASLDTSAERAILRSNPLPFLPTQYRGARISVQFWFEYRR